MENVIVTGATGEIGLALVGELLAQGKNVTVISRPNSKRVGRLPQNSNLHIVECELKDLLDLPGSGKTAGCFDVFYHLGWDYSRDHYNAEKQLLNASYTLNAVEAAEKFGCKCFVGAGSQAEYGRADGLIEEGTPCRPETAYGIAKLCAGQMSRLYCEQKGIRHVWCRIFSVYGPGDAESTMVISVIRQLLTGRVPELTMGEQIWNFLYTSDAARALCMLGEKDACEGIYCIGSKESRQLKSYIEELRDCIDCNLLLKFGARPYSEKQVMNISVNIDKLVSDTGFAQSVKFSEGIRRTIQWCKEHSQVEETGYGI